MREMSVHVRLDRIEHAALRDLARLERQSVSTVLRTLARDACKSAGTWPSVQQARTTERPRVTL